MIEIDMHALHHFDRSETMHAWHVHLNCFQIQGRQISYVKVTCICMCAQRMAMQQGKAHIMALYYMQALLLPTDIHGACNVLMTPFCFLALAFQRRLGG